MTGWAVGVSSDFVETGRVKIDPSRDRDWEIPWRSTSTLNTSPSIKLRNAASASEKSEIGLLLMRVNTSPGCNPRFEKGPE
jgi:hypothetical protein